MWAIILSDRLAVIALVSLYLTNKLIAHDPLSNQKVPEGIPTFTQTIMWWNGTIRH